MSNALTYDLMLESTGILRSHDLRIGLDRDLVAGETIAYHGRRWLVTVVESARSNAASTGEQSPASFPIATVTEHLLDLALVLIGGALIGIAILAG